MARNSAASKHSYTAFEQLRLAQTILRHEADALQLLASSLDEHFCTALNLLYACAGSVIVCGMGKAGLIGQKIVATLGSTGTPSHFLHPSEAVHGDLGRLSEDDCILMLSFSGETEEIVRILPSLQQMRLPIIAITGRAESRLGRASKAVLDVKVRQEACPLELAPSSSTTAMLAVGDALALVLSQMQGFRHEDFARFHPAGSLGRKLSRVEDWMRPLEQCRVSLDSRTVREVVVGASMPGRRTGAIMLSDSNGKLTGIFTDSDLAKMLEGRQQDALDQPISEAMTCAPATVVVGSRAMEALELIGTRKISELPVVDEEGFPVGMIDITDVIHLLPKNEESEKLDGVIAAKPPGPSTLPFPDPESAP